MKSSQKLVVAGIVVAVALAGGTNLSGCWQGGGSAARTKMELAGLAYQRKLVMLIRALQVHRSVGMAFVDGDSTVDFSVSEQDLSDQVTITDRFDTQHGELQGIRDKWKRLSTQIRDLMQTWRDEPRECFRRHAEVIGAAIALLTQVGDASALLTDPTPDTHYLADATTAIPELNETMAQVRDFVTSIATRGGMIRPDEHDLCTSQRTSIKSIFDRINADYEKVYAANERMRSVLGPTRDPANQAVTKLIEMLQDNVIAVDYFTMSVGEWSARANTAIDATQVLHDTSLEALQRQLGGR